MNSSLIPKGLIVHLAIKVGIMGELKASLAILILTIINLLPING